MINKSQIMPMLLEAAPAFAPTWKKHRDWWGERDAGIFIDIGEFADFVVNAYACGDTESFPAIFATIERFLRHGSEEERAAASIGFFEDLQNIASHRPFGSRAFIQWLGPDSMRAWQESEAMWKGKRSLSDVVRAEQKEIAKERK